MIKRPEHPNYSRNQRTSKRGGYPCVVCGKRIPQSLWVVRLHKGGSHIVSEAEGAELNAAGHEGGDLGMQPLGADCLRRHPDLKPYAVWCGMEAGDAQ